MRMDRRRGAGLTMHVKAPTQAGTGGDALDKGAHPLSKTCCIVRSLSLAAGINTVLGKTGHGQSAVSLPLTPSGVI